MKVLKSICVACMLFGALFMLGTAGGSDVGTLTFDEIITHTLISVALMIGGYLGIIAINAVTKLRKHFKHMRKD